MKIKPQAAGYSLAILCISMYFCQYTKGFIRKIYATTVGKQQRKEKKQHL
jgi:hypothetical protein